MHIVIKHLSGPETGRRDVFPVQLSDCRVVIGRDEDCDLAFDPSRDMEVSGKHCEIVRDGNGGFGIRDLGSTNGTFLNGVETKQGPIAVGDEIELGSGGPRLLFEIRRRFVARLLALLFRRRG